MHRLCGPPDLHGRLIAGEVPRQIGRLTKIVQLGPAHVQFDGVRVEVVFIDKLLELEHRPELILVPAEIHEKGVHEQHPLCLLLIVGALALILRRLHLELAVLGVHALEELAALFGLFFELLSLHREGQVEVELHRLLLLRFVQLRLVRLIRHRAQSEREKVEQVKVDRVVRLTVKGELVVTRLDLALADATLAAVAPAQFA